MRIAFSSSFEEGVRAMARAAEALADAQRQLSSGRRISQLSDDPLGSASAIAEHANISRLDSYSSATDAAASRLELSNNIVSDIVQQLTIAQTTALAGRGSTLTQSQRDAAALELLAVRDTILGDINTKFQGVFLFGGSKVTTAPFTQTGGGLSAYQGDAAPTVIEIGPGHTVASTFDGGKILQGSDTQHVLDVLTDLGTAIAANDQPVIANLVDALNRALDRATTAQVEMGTDLRAVDDGRGLISTSRIGAVGRLSDIEDADLAAAMSRLSQAQTAYQAVLTSMSTVGRLSLMDYLK
jgi:flagellar hook-associated protein 3 FlgL